MFFYVKLIAFVILATFGAQYLITKIVFSTQGLPDKFTHTYKERTTKVPSNFGKEPVRAPEPVRAAEPVEPVKSIKPVEVVERAQLALDQDEELADALRNSLQRFEAERAERDEAVADSNAAAAPPVAYAPDAQIGPKARTTNNKTNAGNSNSNNKPRVRADSDADMRVRGNTSAANGVKRESIKANRIDTIFRLTTESPTKKATLVEALDLAYAPPQSANCGLPSNDPIVLGVLYRKSSYAIKGESLTNIDKLIKVYQRCGGGLLLIMPKKNAGAEAGEKIETSARLIQQRQDEVKYYLLQRNVEKDDIVYSDNS